MLLALQHPTQGEARVLGLDAAAGSAEVHRRTGYLPGDLELFPRLTGPRVTLDVTGDIGPALRVTAFRRADLN